MIIQYTLKNYFLDILYIIDLIPALQANSESVSDT